MLRIYPYTNYVAAPLLDGERCLVRIGSDGGFVLTETHHLRISVTSDVDMIFEGKVYDHDSVSQVVVYDMHALAGISMMTAEYAKRLQKLRSALQYVRLNSDVVLHEMPNRLLRDDDSVSDVCAAMREAIAA